MPGRFRTASNPSSTEILPASYVFFSTISDFLSVLVLISLLHMPADVSVRRILSLFAPLWIRFARKQNICSCFNSDTILFLFHFCKSFSLCILLQTKSSPKTGSLHSAQSIFSQESISYCIHSYFSRLPSVISGGNSALATSFISSVDTSVRFKFA